jgi:uncharacterized membrane protein YhaH (DUF805 family)
MDFQTAVKTCFSKYADFTGRARRPELWWFVLFNLVVSGVLNLLDGDSNILSGIYSLAVLLPSLAVGARRLHDIGRSGWWLLISLVPIVGVIVLIWWYIQPGEPGTNRFGPPPADPAPRRVA